MERQTNSDSVFRNVRRQLCFQCGCSHDNVFVWQLCFIVFSILIYFGFLKYFYFWYWIFFTDMILYVQNKWHIYIKAIYYCPIVSGCALVELNSHKMWMLFLSVLMCCKNSQMCGRKILSIQKYTSSIGDSTKYCVKCSWLIKVFHILSRWQYESAFHICRPIFCVSQLLS